MAEIVVHIPTVPYGFVEVRGSNAHEVGGVLADPEFQALVSPETSVEATGAPESDEEVLPEGEALEALKEALGASESPEQPVGDAKAAFLSKFGKEK